MEKELHPPAVTPLKYVQQNNGPEVTLRKGQERRILVGVEALLPLCNTLNHAIIPLQPGKVEHKTRTDHLSIRGFMTGCFKVKHLADNRSMEGKEGQEFELQIQA